MAHSLKALRFSQRGSNFTCFTQAMGGHFALLAPHERTLLSSSKGKHWLHCHKEDMRSSVCIMLVTSQFLYKGVDCYISILISLLEQILHNCEQIVKFTNLPLSNRLYKLRIISGVLREGPNRKVNCKKFITISGENVCNSVFRVNKFGEHSKLTLMIISIFYFILTAPKNISSKSYCSYSWANKWQALGMTGGLRVINVCLC